MDKDAASIADCVNRCKQALGGRSTAQLWEIFADIHGTTPSQAQAEHPNKLRAWLLSEICHHICDETYSKGGAASVPPGDPALDLDPPAP
ncbi:hypothetical protein [Ramlibacter sp.]|uniref:hypothetical protein n=1 Tax=Ramlibacter sp. TaxID=1917967 RepID=UPI003D0EE551